MQTYDLLMLLVLVCATIFGFWKGMAWQLASLASLVVSYIAALQVQRAARADVRRHRAVESLRGDAGDLHGHVVHDLDGVSARSPA